MKLYVVAMMLPEYTVTVFHEVVCQDFALRLYPPPKNRHATKLLSLSS